MKLFTGVFFLFMGVVSVEANDGLLDDLEPHFSSNVPHIMFVENVTDWNPQTKDYSLFIQNEADAFSRCKNKVNEAIERLKSEKMIVLGSAACMDMYGWGADAPDIAPYVIYGRVYFVPSIKPD